MPIGTVICLTQSGYIAQIFNWEVIFYYFGGLGLVWFALWTVLVFDNPKDHPRISKVRNCRPVLLNLLRFSLLFLRTN